MIPHRQTMNLFGFSDVTFLNTFRKGWHVYIRKENVLITIPQENITLISDWCTCKHAFMFIYFFNCSLWYTPYDTLYQITCILDCCCSFFLVKTQTIANEYSVVNDRCFWTQLTHPWAWLWAFRIPWCKSSSFIVPCGWVSVTMEGAWKQAESYWKSVCSFVHFGSTCCWRE